MMIKRFSALLLAAATVGVLGLVAVAEPTLAFEGSTQGGAAAARGSDQPIELFGDGGTFSTITNVLLFIIGAIAVIMIVIGGMRYVLSGGDSAQITAAKNTILYAIVGIIVAILAYAVVNFVLSSLIPGSGGGGGTNV